MPSQKVQKIDLNTEYPCPCRRRGSLVPITLTEAFGCNRCQQIFVVEESGYVIEQLSTSYPYKKAWRWTGHRWNTANASESYVPVALGSVLFLLIVWLPLALIVPSKQIFIIVFMVVALLVVLIPPLRVWLAHRR